MSDMATTTTTERHHEPASKFTPGALPRPALEKTALTLFEEKRRMYTCRAPAGVDAEGLLYEEFWRHVSARLNRDDILYVLADDGSWEAECRVETSKPDGAEISIVKKMRRRAIAQRQTILGDGEFLTEYANGYWNVLRTKDRHPVIKGYTSEGSAITAWLREQPRKA